jgi:uncharacterized damage-inducible protein DinB
MPVTLDVLQDHLTYTAWASKRLLDAASTLTSDELNRDFGTADRSVIGTLIHIYSADKVWLDRVLGKSPEGFTTLADPTLASLQTAGQAVHDAWSQWAGDLNPSSPETEVRYFDLKRREWRQPLWQIILHVVNHGTHHRAQVSGFLRSLGHTPPTTDLAFYHRKQY